MLSEFLVIVDTDWSMVHGRGSWFVVLVMVIAVLRILTTATG